MLTDKTVLGDSAIECIIDGLAMSIVSVESFTVVSCKSVQKECHLYTFNTYPRPIRISAIKCPTEMFAISVTF